MVCVCVCVCVCECVCLAIKLSLAVGGRSDPTLCLCREMVLVGVNLSCASRDFVELCFVYQSLLCVCIYMCVRVCVCLCASHPLAVYHILNFQKT